MGPEEVLHLWVRVELEVIGNQVVLYIPQTSRTGASPSDFFVPYLGH